MGRGGEHRTGAIRGRPSRTTLFAAQAFSGALANGAITGTVTVSHGGTNPPLANGAVVSYGYSASSPVTLQKP